MIYQKLLCKKATPIIFGDDTSIVIARQDATELLDDLTLTFNQISEWFKQNSLSLNINKTYLMHFLSKSVAHSDINIIYEKNYITKMNDLKFLGLNISNTLTWKSHTEKNFTQIKLCMLCPEINKTPCLPTNA